MSSFFPGEGASPTGKNMALSDATLNATMLAVNLGALSLAVPQTDRLPPITFLMLSSACICHLVALLIPNLHAADDEIRNRHVLFISKAFTTVGISIFAVVLIVGSIYELKAGARV